MGAEETIPEEWLELQPLIDEIRTPTEFIARAMRWRFTVTEVAGGREPEETVSARFAFAKPAPLSQLFIR